MFFTRLGYFLCVLKYEDWHRDASLLGGVAYVFSLYSSLDRCICFLQVYLICFSVVVLKYYYFCRITNKLMRGTVFKTH